MIAVAGFNSAVDRLIEVPALRAGHVQRGRRVASRPGGKGVHVAQTIAALGEAVHLVGLVDDTTAAMFASHLHERGVRFHGVRTDAPLRHCMAIVEADGRTTEILEDGADTSDAVRQELDRSLRDMPPRAMPWSVPAACRAALPPTITRS